MSWVAGVLGAIFLFASPVVAQEPTLVVENGRVIRGTGEVVEDASVLVAGDTILSVTRDPVDAPDARRIDASGRTVLPGLIDAHVHLTVPPGGRDSTALVEYLEDDLRGVLRGFLEHGVTTVRSTGGYWPWAGRVRDRIQRGELDGPRVVTAGPTITARRGHPASTVCGGGPSPQRSPTPFCRNHLAAEVGSPGEAREAVRRLAGEGVDFIKLVSDSVVAPVQIEDSVVAAVVDQAHREGLRTLGHVIQAPFMIEYAKLGMDGFAHVPFPPSNTKKFERLVGVLSEQQTYVTTTNVTTMVTFARQPPGEILGRESPTGRIPGALYRMTAALADADVPIVVGTDWRNSLEDHPALGEGTITITEMQKLRWGGMSRHEIIRAATSNAAEALEMDERVGTLEAGKLADLIVVDGNPLEDLSVLEDVDVVVQDGEVVSGPPGM